MNFEKWGWKTRTFIILSGIIAFGLIMAIKCIASEQAFWPPDMIPHPAPIDGPNGPSQPKDCGG